jgi:hypothetical protein
MTTNIETNKRFRLSLDVTETAKKQLESIMESIDATSIAEAVRRALSVYKTCIDVEKSGGEVIFKSKDGKITTLKAAFA